MNRGGIRRWLNRATRRGTISPGCRLLFHNDVGGKVAEMGETFGDSVISGILLGRFWFSVSNDVRVRWLPLTA
ncbi:MAG: hypothetical protein KAW46_08505 [candidate division Zixibacteria bacterium]|nr:hypothetical protein [candidate division Zixibacteria bacterium]